MDEIKIRFFDTITISLAGIYYKVEHQMPQRVMDMCILDYVPEFKQKEYVKTSDIYKVLLRCYHRLDNKSEGAQELLKKIEDILSTMRKTHPNIE